MRNTIAHRREFLRRTTAAAGIAAATLASIGSGPAGLALGLRAEEAPSGGQAKADKVRLGGPVPGSDDPEEMVRAHRALGYRAAYCPAVELSDSTKIRAIRETFEKGGIAIAEVGRWVNLMDADPAKRKANLDLVTEGLALAEEIGALCCVDIAGSFNPEVWFGPHPDNFSPRFFDGAVENARKIIDHVKPKRAKFAYEMMGWALPDSPDAYVKMLRAVDREAFAVHLDPCNLVQSPERFYRTGALLDECFDKLGKWIVSCHAKDLVWDVEMNIHFREVRPGMGSLDYTTYLKRLSSLPHSPPLMLEHLGSAEEYDAARRHLQEFGKSLGIEC